MFTPNERARIRASSGCSERTIKRYEQGEQVFDTTRLRIERAAVEQGIPLPARTAAELKA